MLHQNMETLFNSPPPHRLTGVKVAVEGDNSIAMSGSLVQDMLLALGSEMCFP